MTLDETAKNLKAIAEELPNGAITRIAEMTKYSQSYVSKFFMGEYNLSKKNLPILDAANKMLEEEKKFDATAQKKLNELLSKTKS